MIKKNNEQGFSLIELLLALTILSIVSLTYFGFFGQAFLVGKKVEDKLVAVNLARQYAKVEIQNISSTGCVAESERPNHRILQDIKFCSKATSSPTINDQQYHIWFFGLDDSAGLKRVITQVYIDEQMQPVAETYNYIQ